MVHRSPEGNSGQGFEGASDIRMPKGDGFGVAERALNERLAGIRRRTELSGEQFGKRLGCSGTKVSRVETGKVRPSEADVVKWCEAGGVPEQAESVIAQLQNLDTEYMSQSRLDQLGLLQFQHFLAAKERATSLFRIFEISIIPGFVQTPEYVVELDSRTVLRNLSKELAQATQLRIERSRIIDDRSKNFHFLFPEVLFYNPLCSIDTLEGQIAHLSAVTHRPNVHLGIIPCGAMLPTLAQQGFWIYDDSTVSTGSLAAFININDAECVKSYLRVFAALDSVAAYGARARELLDRFSASLRRHGEPPSPVFPGTPHPALDIDLRTTATANGHSTDAP